METALVMASGEKRQEQTRPGSYDRGRVEKIRRDVIKHYTTIVTSIEPV